MRAAEPVLTAIRERRSVRRYADGPLARQDLLAVLEAGRWAPSGLNNQPWRFLVVPGGDPRQEALARTTKYGPILRRAQALVVVVLKKDEMYSQAKDLQAAGACIQNMLLAAHALGLGAVWVGEILNREAEALAAAGLSPEDFQLMAVLALGRPAEKGSSDRKPLSALLLEEF